MASGGQKPSLLLHGARSPSRLSKSLCLNTRLPLLATATHLGPKCFFPLEPLQREVTYTGAL